MPEVAVYQKRRAPTRQLLIYDASTRILVWLIGLDVAAVGDKSTIQNGDKSIRMDTLLQANAHPRA